MSSDFVAQAAYLIASFLFILGLKRLSTPRTARSGNIVAAIGMALALGGTFVLPGMGNFGLILVAIAIGTAPGWLLAKRVKMTAMPQMVSLFNGMGGACAMFISLGEWFRPIAQFSLTVPGLGTWTPQVFAPRSVGDCIPTLLGVVFGAVSFTGSLVAFGKLQGLITEKPVRYPQQKLINALLVALIVAAGWIAVYHQNFSIWIIIVALSALALGVLQVLPIGGADMPVVISVLNSCTGLAAAVTGFSMQNMAMIIAGTLVGAAGSLLTLLMCKAMNRSLLKVVFGSFGSVAGPGGIATTDQSMREIAASECAIMMGYARKVIIIPGYGLAVGQGQHLVHELEELLEKRGVEVKYAIHPVAGRMPGHMNVLLAEADVPYPKLLDMEEINPEFDQADVALIVGANDVVNPAARTDPGSPIYGMPILNADKAKNVIVIKRGRGAGFAGIENGLFYDPKTRMLFGDAKKALQELVSEVKAL
ncbi:MAG TPA: NAD(P)(+) transhydrogenase (Re/Si-specific) subunit beta [Verrucomicrobiae bacterium]|jgi:NAD(P) transhydrogenase subunit beta|nr:NAD(P)(+) transhydrogenase (Re/Si-specific) subunit beta [Verrucomicrobiae bacterium]